MPHKFVVLVAEDELSFAILRKLVQVCSPNLCIDRTVITRGFGQIKSGFSKYIQASTIVPHIVLTDLDNYRCPVSLIEEWGIGAIPNTCLFRIAVKEIEAWLLADRVGFAEFLNISLNLVPPYPEQELDPKQTLLHLAKRSRRKGLAKDLLPEAGSAASIGPLYNQRLSQFVAQEWDLTRASENSESLSRSISRISKF